MEVEGIQDTTEHDHLSSAATEKKKEAGDCGDLEVTSDPETRHPRLERGNHDQ